MPVVSIDLTTQLIVADKASLCTLSHTGIGSFGVFGILVFPQRALASNSRRRLAMCSSRVRKTVSTA